MKAMYKTGVGIIIGLIVLAVVLCRIIYVNTVLFETPQDTIYSIHQQIPWNGLQVKVTDYLVYNREEIIALYQDEELRGIADPQDIFIELAIENVSDVTRKVNLTGCGMMYGYKYGGNANPYLYGYLNNEHPGLLELEAGETVLITLPFPYESENENPTFILSLYPEKVKIVLKND